MKLVREFLEWDDNLYEVLRKINESNNPIIDAWMEKLDADKVLRRGEYLFFCRKVEDAVIIENENEAKIEENENIESTGTESD